MLICRWGTGQTAENILDVMSDWSKKLVGLSHPSWTSDTCGNQERGGISSSPYSSSSLVVAFLKHVAEAVCYITLPPSSLHYCYDRQWTWACSWNQSWKKPAYLKNHLWIRLRCRGTGINENSFKDSVGFEKSSLKF